MADTLAEVLTPLQISQIATAQRITKRSIAQLVIGIQNQLNNIYRDVGRDTVVDALGNDPAALVALETSLPLLTAQSAPPK